MSIVRRALLVAALACAAFSPASAHRGHDALSVVAIAADRTLTVSHRFEASDIEPALATIAPNAQPSLDDPDAIAALVAYLGRRFIVSSEGGAILLTPGAVELGASEVRIAFTGTVPRAARRLTVRSDLLGDVYPGQLNQVNVRSGTTMQTFALTAGDTASIDLASPARRAVARPRSGR